MSKPVSVGKHVFFYDVLIFIGLGPWMSRWITLSNKVPVSWLHTLTSRALEPFLWQEVRRVRVGRLEG